jgi:hypothetical protein
MEMSQVVSALPTLILVGLVIYSVREKLMQT